MSAKTALRDDQRAAIAAGDFRHDRWRDRLLAAPTPEALTRAWRPLIPHPEQIALAHSPARFKIVAAGRRSGKTVRALRHLVRMAMGPQNTPDALYVYAAPTRDQAKRIAWEYLKALVPPWARDRRRGRDGISESELTIFLCQGAQLAVVGMDRPQRLEGVAVDGIVLDEYAEMKPEAWTSTVRPALDTINRPGWAWFVGRPKGTNHFYDLVNDFGLDAKAADWDFFTWWSEDIASEDTIAAARRDLDPRTFDQEYRAAFVNQEGRVYYAFDRNVHAIERLTYDATLPLVLCFDFNVDPGVCVYVQEQPYGGTRKNVAASITAVFGEVFIPRNSNTPAVCDAILRDFGKGGAIAEHRGDVFVYGDPAGGARGTTQIEGSDWDMIRARLRPVFGGRYRDRVARDAPAVRSRVNAVNSRLLGADGTVKLLVDPANAKHVVADLADVVWKDGSGDIDKPSGTMLSHTCFGAGTLVATPDGDVEIDRLFGSGFVFTAGRRETPFEAGGWRGELECVEVLLDDCSCIVSTRRHQFLTHRGWMAAADLEGAWLCDATCPHSSSTAERIAATVGTSGDSMGTCIATCGSTTTERSRRGITSITATATPRTTRSRTSSSSTVDDTFASTCAIPRDSRSLDTLSRDGLDRLRRRGIATQRIDRGEWSSSTRGRCASRGIDTAANGARRPTAAADALAAAARTTARLAGATTLASITRRAFVARADVSSASTATSERSAAHANARRVIAVRPVGPRDVFCVTVPRFGCFALASGIIVSNSDALGYFLHEKFPVYTLTGSPVRPL